MDLVPVIVLSKQQGVPIPSNNFSFTLSKDAYEKFKTKEVSIRGAPLKDAFLISVSREDSLALNLLLSDEEKLESASIIGVFCQLQKTEKEGSDHIVTCRVLARAKINKYVNEGGCVSAPLQIVREKLLPGEEELLTDLRLLVAHLVEQENKVSEDVKRRILNTKDIIKISNILAVALPLTNDDQYDYIQFQDNLDRFTLVLKYLIRLLGVKGMSTAVERQRKRVPDGFPENFISLLQQMENAAQRAQEQHAEEQEMISSSIAELPPKVADKIAKEHKRLQQLPPSSMEYQSVQEYVDWIMSIPWGKETTKKPDLKNLINEFNKSHYGLPEVKEHVLEYMCIEAIANSTKGSVLCFAGPPGTGKTTIAKKIAELTNRKIVKIALGGMSDEAEIRGHRRTYVAAKPGRIITGLQQVETMDPLILLDEVDKTSSYRGDPVSALLELLDPEQHDEFIDRYLEVPVDLSKAMFICTANYVEDIPAPLLDRLELVNFREYTTEERVIIAKDYLLPKAIKDYKLEGLNINFPEEIFKPLCKDKGVRDVERKIRKLLRKAAVSIIVNEEEQYTVTEEILLDTFKENKDGVVGF
ncbi:MAG: hypothetical protein CMQ41_15775 [Gammaproteobacteria bacterium]|nr:hypothetical protein [Gammaproteobacteria bacterium]